MGNDFNNKQGQSTMDKASEFTRTSGQQIEEKGKDMIGDAQKTIKQGQEKIGKFAELADKQVRENPWPILAGVAVISWVIGRLMASRK